MKSLHIWPGLKAVNTFLSWIVILLSLYIIAAPLLPQVAFWGNKLHNNPSPAIVAAQQAEHKQPVKDAAIPSDNTLVIPSINLEEVIHEGADGGVLRLGVWRRPQTSTPPQGGNTVIVGHRFTYAGPADFYHLDKVKTGDTLTIFWERQAYTYKVYAIQITAPAAVEIEYPTTEPTLTLYTCTPLWSASKRLVIKATLLENQP